MWFELADARGRPIPRSAKEGRLLDAAIVPPIAGGSPRHRPGGIRGNRSQAAGDWLIFRLTGCSFS
jgi:hypothetical protein